MKVKLPESARERKRSFGGATVSTLLHAVLVGGTVAATGAREELRAIIDPPERPVYIQPTEKDPPKPAPPPEQRPPVEIPTDVEPVPAINTPPIDVSVIPTGLPPVDTRIGTMRVEEFATTARDTVVAGVGDPADPGTTFTEFTVEKAVQARNGNPTPQYPRMLASSGIEGKVMVQFVVDTTGRVEPASIAFVFSDHVLFERAVRDVLLRSRYVPAEFGGRHVRQLVEQAFAFALTR